MFEDGIDHEALACATWRIQEDNVAAPRAIADSALRHQLENCIIDITLVSS